MSNADYVFEDVETGEYSPLTDLECIDSPSGVAHCYSDGKTLCGLMTTDEWGWLEPLNDRVLCRRCFDALRPDAEQGGGS